MMCSGLLMCLDSKEGAKMRSRANPLALRRLVEKALTVSHLRYSFQALVSVEMVPLTVKVHPAAR